VRLPAGTLVTCQRWVRIPNRRGVGRMAALLYDSAGGEPLACG